MSKNSQIVSIDLFCCLYLACVLWNHIPMTILVLFPCLVALSNPLVALLSDGEPDALALRQRHQGLVPLADDEHVGQTGGK